MYEQLLEITDKPKNISLNLPNQKISIYEVIENVDLVLNSWSSVGKDLALLGLPVITYGIETFILSRRFKYSFNFKSN